MSRASSTTRASARAPAPVPVPSATESAAEPGKFLLDQIQPFSPIDFVFNRQAWLHLAAIAASDDMPHLLITGPPGSGKKTMLQHLLRTMFGSSVEDVQVNNYKITSSGNNTKKMVPIMQSDHHIVVQPNNNNFDRYIIQDVITQYARRVPLRGFVANRSFRAVVINGIDRVSRQAQMSLRSTMEYYSRQCRLIMSCTSSQKVLKQLRSRCFCIALRAPTIEDVQLCVARAILMCKLPRELLCMTTVRTRDLREAFRQLEAMRWGAPFKTSYDTQITEIIQLIIERNSANVSEIRAAFYELMITNFTGSQIITSIVDELLADKRIRDADKVSICEYAALYESRDVVARREIKHLEAFAIASMIQIKLTAAQRVRTVPKPEPEKPPVKVTAPSTNKKKTAGNRGQRRRATSVTPAPRSRGSSSTRKQSPAPKTGGRGRSRSR